jgi:F5/8 type C domain-containing protein
LSELDVWGIATRPLARATAAPRDFAFNPGNTEYPRASASFTSEHDRIEQLNDMRMAFTRYSRNRWTAYQSPNLRDWVEIDFNAPKSVHTIELYFYGDDGGIKAPRDYSLQIWTGDAWQDARVLSRDPERPLASARNVVTIAPVETSRIRVVLEHDLPAFSGITELIVR